MCCAHCNCMAGLGETCTHIAAVLFHLEAAARIQGKQTSTQHKCEWILPSFQKNVEYLPINKIDFTSARGKKIKLDDAIDSSEPVPSSEETSAHKAAEIAPSIDVIDAFYEELS